MDKITKFIAVSLLGIMFVLIFFSAWNDSATMDELAHIPSGYSYLALRDYRLNPEHPPLIKDLSAIPLLFLNLNFPADAKAWRDDVNGQWDMGRLFLYESGNNADKIIHFARFPIMLLAILFGWLLFKWARGLYGNKVALLTLFFYAMSPTFIAHSRYVTTDLGAAFGFFIGLATFVNFIQNQTKKNLIIAGIAFGAAQLLKFSLFILAPIYFILIIIWAIAANWGSFKNIFKDFIKLFGKLLIIGVIGLLIIWPVYQFHVWNYPAERQTRDAQFILSSFGIRPLANLVVWMSDKPVLRPLGQYLFGLLMVVQRSAGGNDFYFLGAISAAGSRLYFPLLYLLKEHLAFHILTIIAIIFAARNIVRAREKNLRVAMEWIKDNFALTTAMIFIAVYAGQSVSSSLNIGVRHILPTFPFVYLLVSRQIIRWSQNISLDSPKGFLQWLHYIYQAYIKKFEKYSFVMALLLWMFLSTLLAFPYYLSFFNALGGGTENGYKIAVDSNYDWGQDLKRLKDYVETWNLKHETKIEKIGIDYFGGGNPKYYFGDPPSGGFESWQSSKGAPDPSNGGPQWFAISLTFLQSSQGKPVKGFTPRAYEDTYPWLKNKIPFARAGTSIFIYKF